MNLAKFGFDQVHDRLFIMPLYADCSLYHSHLKPWKIGADSRTKTHVTPSKFLHVQHMSGLFS